MTTRYGQTHYLEGCPCGHHPRDATGYTRLVQPASRWERLWARLRGAQFVECWACNRLVRVRFWPVDRETA
jgi:hypothetical protein